MTFAPAWEAAFAPRDRRPTWEWSKDALVCSPPLTQTGALDFTTSRHLIEPLNALDDEYIREVNILMPIRGGKTLVAGAHIMSIVKRRPGPIASFMQDDKAGKDQAKQRTWKLIRESPTIAAILSGNYVGDVATDISFSTGAFIHIRGPAEGNLHSRGYQYVIADECHLYTPGVIGKARTRMGDYIKRGDEKLLCISQGGSIGSDWDAQFRSGLIHTWHVQCLNCGVILPGVIDAKREDGVRWGLIFDTIKDDNGFWLADAAAETVRWECRDCHHPHTDFARTKLEWNRLGQYIAEVNPAKSKVKKSYRCEAVIDYPWKALVSEYLEAVNELKRGSSEKLQDFDKAKRARMSSETAVREGAVDSSRRVKYNILEKWEFEDMRAMAIDVQQHHFWVQIRAFSRRLGGRSRRIAIRKCYSFVECDALREEFKVERQRVLVDSGFRARPPGGADGAYAAAIRYGWTCVKGADKEREFFHKEATPSGEFITVRKSYSPETWGDPGIGQAGQCLDRAPLFLFSAWAMADRLDGDIASGMWEEPAESDDPLEEEYKVQMASEFKKTEENKKTHRVTEIRVCPSRNNHFYDTGKMLELAAVWGEVVPDPIMEQVKKTT